MFLARTDRQEPINCLFDGTGKWACPKSEYSRPCPNWFQQLFPVHACHSRLCSGMSLPWACPYLECRQCKPKLKNTWNIKLGHAARTLRLISTELRVVQTRRGHSEGKFPLFRGTDSCTLCPIRSSHMRIHLRLGPNFRRHRIPC